MARQKRARRAAGRLRTYRQAAATTALAVLAVVALSVAQTTLASVAARGKGLRRVLVVGDSLEVGTGPYLQRRGATVDARGGRPSSEGVGVLRQRLRPGHRAVVFDLGTNDASVGELRRSLRQARQVVGGRELYVSTVNSPSDQRAKNRLLKRFARKSPNIHLVRAASKVAPGPDGIHYSPQGYRQRGRLLARALRPDAPAAHTAGISGRPRGAVAGASASSRRPTARQLQRAKGSKRLPDSVYDAINRAVTPEFGRWAQKTYGVGGKRLLALVAAGEGGGSIDEGNTPISSAGAKGPFQFIPSTRSAYIQQYGVDPWKNDVSAAKAAMIHLKGTGLAGYNPGMPSYPGYILGQDVDTRPLLTGGRGSARRGGGGGRDGRGGGGGVRGQLRVTQDPSVERGSVEPGGEGISTLLAQLLQERDRPVVQSAGVAPPAFSASAVMPAGYRAPASSGGPVSSGDGLDEALAAVSGLVGEPPPRSTVTPGQVERSGQMGGGRGSGGRGGGGGRRSVGGREALFDVKKDGWKGARSVGIGLSRIGLGLGLESISEKRDTVSTASGGVSDHYRGNRDSYAWDMSDGSQPTPGMDKTAMRIAKALGAGGQWRKQGRAGVLNVTKKIEGRTYRFQMLYRTNTGGNHYNHVHLGVDRVDTPG